MTRSQQIVLTLGLLGVAILVHWYAVDWRVAQGSLGRFIIDERTQGATDALRSSGLPAAPVVIFRVTGGNEPVVLLASHGLGRTPAFFLGAVLPPVLAVAAYFLELGGYAARKERRVAAQGLSAEPTAASRKRSLITNVVVGAVVGGILVWAAVALRSMSFR